MQPKLFQAAVYERRIRAGVERVWENVHDWEHLPWLHASSFESIELEEAGEWGWRAGLVPRRGAPIRLELVREGDRYVSRTLEGAGVGTEIWTSVHAVDPDHSDIRVEFWLPDGAPATAGDRLRRMYVRLWDEDEAMMRHRATALAASSPGASPDPLDLGPVDALRASLPRIVDFGGARYRLVLHQGEVVAHSTVCPHWRGPLDEATLRDGCVTCPWHGYRFDVVTGERRDAQSRMRLAKAPRVRVDGRGHATLS